jgi:hypothetical protein
MKPQFSIHSVQNLVTVLTELQQLVVSLKKEQLKDVWVEGAEANIRTNKEETVKRKGGI